MKSKSLQQTLIFSLLLLPTVTFAQFQPLVGIPGISDPTTDINTYINVLYALSISIAALLAVIKIIIAGVKYMLSDIVTSKQEAKSDIQGALLGLLIVISAVLILNVINPQLTETTLFVGTVDQVPFNNSALSGGGGGAASPLPPAAAATAGPIAKGDIDCAPHPTLQNQFDCTAAIASCTAARGVQVPEGFVSDKSDITCRYGTATPVDCAGDDNSVGGYDNVSCTAARAACVAVAGQTFTAPAQSNQIRATCFRPARP